MPLDEADKKAIADMIAGAFKPDALAAALNPIVEAHVKAAVKDVPTAKSIGESIAAEVAKLKVEPDPNAGKGGKGKDETDPAVTALQKRLDEQQTKLEAAERARVDAVKAATIDGNRGKVRDALAKAGLDADAIRRAMPLIEASGNLLLEGDKPGWKGKDQYNLDAIHDFEAGAAAWAKTDDGKHYLPATGVRGTGDGNNGDRRVVQNGTATLASLQGDPSLLNALMNQA